jgi:hypothetical protein
MSHPLLTRWLAISMHERGHEAHKAAFADVAGRPGDHCHDEATWIIEEDLDDWDMDPDIADRLERALDVCQYVFQPLVTGVPPQTCGRPAADHRAWKHPYQPLVTP